PVAAVQVESQILAALMSAIESGKDVPEGSLSSTVTIFSCVKSYIRTLAHRLETERLSEFLRSTPLLTVDPAWLTETLRSDLIVHRQSAKSRQLLLDALCANRRSFLVGSYAGDLTPAETERLNLLLEKDPTFTDIIRRRLAERVDALLPEIRGAVAQSQYAENFGHLESLTVLPDVLLSEIHSTQGALPSSVDAALTFLNRGDILVPDFPDDLLDEAILLLLQRIHNLISVAQAALTRQLELVKDIESSQQETLRRDMAAGAMQHAMQNDWFLQFQGRWSEAVSKAPTAYTQMTAPARDAINVAFFRLYEDALQEQMRTMETRLVEQAQIGSVAGPVAPPPQVGEEAQIAALLEGVVAPPVESVLPSPPASPVQGMIPDVLMVLSGELADRCEVSLSIPAFEVSVAFTVEIADADAAASSLFLQIRPYMAQLARYAQSRWKDRPWRFGRRHSGESPEVTVHLQIESREVRHRTIHLLQRFLEAELGTRGNQLEPPTDVTLAFDVLL
ncbi:MAG TPA: hypothetical protein DCS43_06535, partial [Verrucomicrobia bacterium]|nr:hypothetical protein [Verrucomicrobiota bacterium]